MIKNLFILTMLFFVSCSQELNRPEENSYNTSIELRTEKQKKIDFLRQKLYGIEELIQYNNTGDFDRYVVIQPHIKSFVIISNNSPYNVIPFKYLGYDIIEQEKISKGLGELKIYSIKSKMDNKFYYKNGKVLNIESPDIYINKINEPMSSPIIHAERVKITDSIELELKRYIEKKDFESLFNVYLDKPILIIKFLRKGETLDIPSFIEKTIKSKIPSPDMLLWNTSEDFKNEYYEYMRKKF
jgi:hypothetical protein